MTGGGCQLHTENGASASKGSIVGHHVVPAGDPVTRGGEWGGDTEMQERGSLAGVRGQRGAGT